MQDAADDVHSGAAAVDTQEEEQEQEQEEEEEEEEGSLPALPPEVLEGLTAMFVEKHGRDPTADEVAEWAALVSDSPLHVLAHFHPI